jgi:hypothetical protein
MTAQSYPELHVALGRHLARVAAASTYRLDPERLAAMSDAGPYVIEDPVELVYDDAELGFRLPPAPFVWLSTAAGRVFEITATPSLDVVSLDAAHREAGRISAALDRSAWKPATGPIPSRGEIAAEFAASPREHYAFRLRAWEADGKRLVLSIKRLRRDGPAPSGDRFILEVKISSDDLEDRYMKMVRQKREDPAVPLPLAAWPDED